MKRTLMTLMALAGVVTTAEATTEYTNVEFNNWFASAISATGYRAGDDYTFTVTLGSWPSAAGSVGYRSGFILQMTDDWGLFTQAGEYLAFDASSTNDRDGLTTSAGSYASTNTSEATGSLAQGTEGWFYTYGAANRHAGTVITVSRSSGVDTVAISQGETAIANFTITGDAPLDASAYSIPNIYTNDAGESFGFNIQTASFTANGITKETPEPATATLSLLALAGLAARRRRK
ncbi:MAG: PEP-CTERM sorting domain-containing protein [Akkermansia sp.]